MKFAFLSVCECITNDILIIETKERRIIMDIGTLNEYLWIVVVLMVGSVLLAFSTPFGNYLFNELTAPVIEALMN